jgi:hypothetical protein
MRDTDTSTASSTPAWLLPRRIDGDDGDDDDDGNVNNTAAAIRHNHTRRNQDHSSVSI